MVRIVVPFSAGSATDMLARAVADKLSEKWKQQVIVENRPGIAGTTTVAKSTADGYTLMLTSNGHTVAGVLNKRLQFDPVKDFAGITPVASVPLVLIVESGFAGQDRQGIDRTRQGQARHDEFRVAGARLDHLHRRRPVQGCGEDRCRARALQGRAGIQHERGARRLADIISRRPTRPSELVQSGKVRALAVATNKRVPTMPDVPTLNEAGLSGFSYDSWFGLMAPAGTPAAIIEKINKDVVEGLKDPALQDRMAKQGGVRGLYVFAEAIRRDDQKRYRSLYENLPGRGARREIAQSRAQP